MVSKLASFKARLTVANGIFMSKLIYMIPLWSGCPDYLTNALQICQNKAARIVTRAGKYTHISQLLKQCGWRSVRQEMAYHTILTLHNIFLHKQPLYLYRRLTADGPYPYSTRRASSSSIRQSTSFKTNLDLCKQSFRWRGAALYEKIPASIRVLANMEKVKKALDTWVKQMV